MTNLLDKEVPPKTQELFDCKKKEKNIEEGGA